MVEIPFFNNFGIKSLGRAHKLRDKIAKHANENHNHRERDQHPISNCSIQHQIFSHCSNTYLQANMNKSGL